MVYQQEVALPPPDEREILRYAGAGQAAPETAALLRECLSLTEGKLHGRVCWAEYAVHPCEAGLDLGFARTDSHALTRHLQGCERMVLFAATIGLEMDRLIARQAQLSPAKAHMLESIGTERIESVCDAFCAGIAHARPRFSPGYGDVPLAMQRDVFAALNCPRHIGVSLSESLLMTPRKSVTAIVGIGDESCTVPNECSSCRQPNCPYRRKL